MTSPLLSYSNASLLITAQGEPSIENGRVVTTAGTSYVVQCYLTRQQSTGTSSGADYLPTQTSPGEILPGSSGVVYLYAGYALRYGQGDLDNEPTVWTTLPGEEVPSWLTAGTNCKHKQGDEQPKHCLIERTSGKYGNIGIDQIINKEIGGIPLLIRSGELMN